MRKTIVESEQEAQVKTTVGAEIQRRYIYCQVYSRLLYKERVPCVKRHESQFIQISLYDDIIKSITVTFTNTKYETEMFVFLNRKKKERSSSGWILIFKSFFFLRLQLDGSIVTPPFSL